MHQLTSFVRITAKCAYDWVAWRVRVMRDVLALGRVTGADGEDPPPPAPEDKKFSQEEVDRIVSDRLARDRRDRPSDEEIEELRKAKEKLAEVEAENQTELEREQTARKEAEAKVEAAEKQAAEATAKTNDALRRAEIMRAATAEKAVDPAAVHALLKDRGFKVKDGENEFEVTVGDDGQVANAEEVVKKFLSADGNKYLVGSTPSPGPGDGGAREPVPPKDIDDQIAEAEEKKDWPTFNRLNALKLGQSKE